jgi:Amidohydrolase family
MRFLFHLILFCLFCLQSFSQTLIAITHVNIVDVKNEKIIPDQTVLIKGDRIEKIGGSVKLPKSVYIVSGKDKFLIPGLWDMHFHNDDDESSGVTDSAIIPLLIANGVTGVRDMFGLDNTIKRRDSIRAGKFIGPETYVGAMVDGPQPMQPFALAVKSPARGVFMVDSLKNRGYDFIKVYSALPGITYDSIAAESKKQHIPFEGHIPQNVTPVEAALEGQKSMEHQLGMIYQCSSLLDSVKYKDRGFQSMMAFIGGKFMDEKFAGYINSYDTSHLDAAAKIFVQTGVWYCPTLITAQNYMRRLSNVRKEMENDSLMLYATKSARQAWVQMAMMMNSRSNDWTERIKGVELLDKIEKRLYDKKVNMLVGDDNNNPFCFAGFSLHQELMQFVRCGIPDAEALKIATYNPAVFFDIENQFGGVQQGKIASLVLLDANPLQQISNTKRIHAVFLRGKYYDRQALDNLLAGVKAYCQNH